MVEFNNLARPIFKKKPELNPCCLPIESTRLINKESFFGAFIVDFKIAQLEIIINSPHFYYFRNDMFNSIACHLNYNRITQLNN
jgi:hypothetical protein